MSSKKYEIDDLRTMLFQQMEKLDDPTIDLEKELKKAEVKMQLGNVIINSARTQVEYLKVLGAAGNLETEFLGHVKQLGDGSK